MTPSAARAKALAAGATEAEIDAETEHQRRRHKTVRQNMIFALQVHPFRNTREDWVRLAGALAV